ncbi:thioredoxin domain-containing protein [Phnomibacter ginsenosidimutans]|uniref:thioredoxin domain-containing protein n=1 Tax=Phnomibacter ginsenosidimutans TaxID=2676868 RepID=UPI001FEBC988|nr:thioredoxin domain-containing protein [Phnomibacter ginsenosidimutans]
MANRLAQETSPYLQQHAHNPVDWYPWCQEALDRAKAENKPILISIGYSACHWCHVMERESFENVDTANIMNRHFINIKVDREERPDLDAVYMDAVQAISGSGGWPLNVFLTPEALPFYGGTYFPPVRAYNRSSWREVLHAIAKAWQEKPQEILSQATNLTSHLQNANSFGVVAGQAPFTEDALLAMAQQLLKAADTTWGGFGQAPKFPQTKTIGFLLRQYHFLTKQKEASNLPFAATDLLQQAELSLQKMMAGGIYDHLAGGFARYSTDARWLAPHFEKMLYDNALLVGVLSEAYQLTRKPAYAQVIHQTMRFVQQEWQSPEGGFYSAYDADSEGVEGKFYTWSKAELETVIDDAEAARLFCAVYDVSEEGNWEETNILWTPVPVEEVIASLGWDSAAAHTSLAQSRSKLLSHRQQRIKPLLDDKKLLSWNAMMIEASCKAWAATGEADYLAMAEKAAAFIEQYMRHEDGGYFHNEKNGLAQNPAFLDDLAGYVSALLWLQACTGSHDYLHQAGRITDIIFRDFSDADSPFFFFTPVWQKDIIVRKKKPMMVPLRPAIV